MDSKGCWEWKLVVLNSGYAHLNIGKKQILAHRASYTAFKGDIKKGMVIDHLCQNKKCVNPNHLEQVTHSENINRYLRKVRKRHKDRVMCSKGHKLAGGNVFVVKEVKKDGKVYFFRRCKECSDIRNAARYK